MESAIKRKHILVLISLSVLAAGCAAGSYGRLVHSKPLMDQYRDRGLADNYTYYYNGRANLPYAVVGIDPAYTFADRLWSKIESRDEVYRKIGNLSDLDPLNTIMHAKEIVNASGRVVGTWFSYYNTTAVEIDEAARQITVYSPYKPGSWLSPGE